MPPTPLKRLSIVIPIENGIFARTAPSLRARMFPQIAFCVLLTLFVGSSGLFAQSFLVDFGPWTTSNSSVTTPPAAAVIQNGNYWNFLNNSTAYTNPVTTIEGATSAVNITQSGGTFNTGVQFVSGSPNLSNLGVFNIDTVFLDAIFAAANTTGSVNLSSLNSNQTYDFILFGSRVATDNRTTTYTVNGSSSSSGTLQTSGTNLGGAGINYNNSLFYTALGIAPNASSNITVTYVNPTGFSYLSAMGVVGYASYGNGSSITLSSAKDYPGATVLSNGTTLNANATGALGNSTTGSPLVFRSSNSTVNLGADQTIGSLSGNGTLNASTYSLTIKDNTSSFYLFNTNGTLNNVGNNTFSGNITGSGTINKTGNQTLTLSGSGNTFNGTLTVSSGTLALGNVNAVQNTTLIANSTVTLDATGTYTIGALGGSADINIGNRTVYMGANNASTVYSGNLTGSAPIYTRGTGTLTLSGSNSFTGGLWVGGGTLLVGSNNALGSNATGTITLDYNVAGARDIAAAGSSSYTISRALDIYRDLNLGQSSVNTGSLTFAGSIVLGNESGQTRNITTAANTSHTFSGAVSGARGIIKEGAGTLTLSGANTYTGPTTINAGTLLVNGNSASTTVTANAGVIGGTGSVGDLVVNSGARVAPGVASSISTLSANTLTLAGGAGYTWQIGNVSGTAGTNWDLLNIGGGSGTATISATPGSKFTIYVTSTGIPTGWSPGSSGNWDIIDWGTVTGFDSNAFAIDTSGFGGVLSGTWSVSNTGGFLNLAYAGVAVPTWNGGTGNWSAGFTQTPVNADNIFFAGSSAATATNNISSATLNTVANITFESTAGAFTLAANSGSAGYDASSALAITGFILNSSNADQTLNTALSFGGNSTIYASSGNLIFSGPLANAQTLTIADNGGVQVTGAISNNGTILQSGNGSTSVIGAISGSGALTKNGSGTLTLSGANTYTGVTTINAGTLALSGGSAIVDSGTVALNSGGTLTLGGAETIGSVTGAGNIILNANLNTGGANANDTLSGTISGTGELQKAGSGTLTLSGSNSFTGLLRHGDGTILIGNNNAAGASGSGEILIYWDGGAKSIAASGTSNYTISRAMNIYNDLNLGQSTTNTGALTFSGAIALGDEAGQTRTLTVAANNTHQLSGVVASGGRGIVKAGTGTLILSGNNTYVGGTILNAGTIQLSHANGLGTTGNVTFGGGTLLYGSGVTTDLSSRMKNSGSAIAVDTNGQTITFASAIDSSNTGGLTKTGTGTLILSANNTYTGTTTLSSGSLHIGVGGTSGSLASANIVNNGSLTVNRSNTYTLSGNISGTGNLIKTGATALTLSGSNSFSGGISLTGGSIVLGAANSAGTGTIDLRVSNQGFDLNGQSLSNTITATAGSPVFFNSSTTASILSGTVSSSGGTTIYLSNRGDIEFASRVYGTNGFYLNVSGQSVAGIPNSSVGGNVTLSGGGADNSNLSINMWAGSTLTLNKTSSASVHAMGGQLNSTHGSALIRLAGTGDDQIWDGSTVNMNAGGFDMNGRNETITNMRLNGDGPNGLGALRNNSAGTSSTLTLSGTLALGVTDVGGAGSAPRIGGAGNLTVAGVMTGTTGFTKVGVGALTLTANNTFTGATLLNAGTLQIGNGGTSGSLAAAGTLTNNGTLIFNRSDNITQGTQFSSTAIDGTGSLVQNGSGTLTLNAANSFSGGVTINSGTLDVSGGNALNNSTVVTVASGGTFLVSTKEQILGLAGSGAVNVGSAGLDVSTSTATTNTFSGVLAGTGTLDFFTVAGGEINLAGNNTATSDTNLNGGNLRLSHVDAAKNLSLNLYGTTGKQLLFGAGNNTYNIGAMAAAAFAIDLGGNTLSIGAKNVASTMSGNLSGTGGGITKVGTAALTLSGSNSYTGGTSLNAGTLNIGHASALGTGTFTIGNGTTIDNTSGGALTLAGNNALSIDNTFTFTGTHSLNLGTGAINRSGAIVINGTNNATLTLGGVIAGASNVNYYSGSGGTLEVAGANTFTGYMNVDGGKLKISNVNALQNANFNPYGATASVEFGVAGTNTYNIGMLVSSKAIDLGGNTISVGANNESNTYSGNLSGSGGSVVKVGTGTWTLSGTNSYTGATTISAGTLSISSSAALGSTSGVDIGSGATLTYSGGSATLDRAITASAGTATLRNTGGGTLALSGALSKNGTTLTFAQGAFNVTGAIGGSAANSDLVVDTATVTLNGANTYNGPTIIRNGGALTANVANALPTANGRTTVVMDATGTGSSSLTLGASQSIASLEGAATSTVALGSNTLTTGTTSGTTAFAGTISGSGNIVKDGASTQRLTGANTFTGTTTISSGTLEAAAANALGSTSSIVVQNGGSLLVTSDDALSSTATISLGSGSSAAGILFQGNYEGYLGALTLTADSIIDLGTGSVQLIFDSIAGLDNYRLTFWNWSGNTQWSGNPGGGTDQVHFTNNSASGLPNDLDQVSFYSDAGMNLLSNNAFLVNSNPREIVAVPEPSAIIAGLILLGGLAIQFLRQKRRQRLP